MLKYGIKRRILILAALFSLSCSIYHMQTPKTVPRGETTAGVGLVSIVNKNSLYFLPGLWIRYGLSDKLDLGIHAWSMGLKGDAKYGFNEYFGLGAGVFAAVPPEIFEFGSEGSVYAGIPAGRFYPYVVGRVTAGWGTSTLENSIFNGATYLGSGVVGLKWNVKRYANLYIEGGIAIIRPEIKSKPVMLFGIGLSGGE